MSTGFSVEKSIFASDRIGFRGNVGYGTNCPTSVLRASFQHNMTDGSGPSIAVTMWNAPAPDLVLHNFEALALTSSDDVKLGDRLEVKFGSELESIQFMGRVTTFRPFGAADFHLSPNTVLEYAYTTSEPDSRLEKGFDSVPTDADESTPRVSMTAYSPTVEHAHHHEVSSFTAHRKDQPATGSVRGPRIRSGAERGWGIYDGQWNGTAGRLLGNVHLSREQFPD